MRPGDVITEVDGRTPTTSAAVVELIMARLGQRIVVTVQRGAAVVAPTISVPAGEW